MMNTFTFVTQHFVVSTSGVLLSLQMLLSMQVKYMPLKKTVLKLSI